MFSNRPHRVGTAWSARRWSWLAPVLALGGMLLPMTGWQAAAQLQNLGVAGSSSDEGENEFPGEEEGGNAADGDLEAHLLIRRWPRETIPHGLSGETSVPLTDDGHRASSARGIDAGRDAAASRAARLPLRC